MIPNNVIPKPKSCVPVMVSPVQNPMIMATIGISNVTVLAYTGEVVAITRLYSNVVHAVPTIPRMEMNPIAGHALGCVVRVWNVPVEVAVNRLGSNNVKNTLAEICCAGRWLKCFLMRLMLRPYRAVAKTIAAI